MIGRYVWIVAPLCLSACGGSTTLATGPIFDQALSNGSTLAFSTQAAFLDLDSAAGTVTRGADQDVAVVFALDGSSYAIEVTALGRTFTVTEDELVGSGDQY